MQLDDATTILARADFFEVCDAEERRMLAFASERKKYKPGSVLYSAGEVPEGAHVLISGTVSTLQGGDGAADPFVVSGPGSVIGTVSLILARERPVTVKAIDAVETLFVPRSAFLKLCQQSPDLAARAADRLRKELAAYLTAIEKIGPKIGATTTGHAG